MVAIKDMQMPKACTSTQEVLGDIEVSRCPLYNVCKYRDTTKNNYKPNDCPLAEIVTCKDCKYWYRDGLSAISGNCEKLSHRERNSTLYVEIERKTVETSYCSDGKRRGSEE